MSAPRSVAVRLGSAPVRLSGAGPVPAWRLAVTGRAVVVVHADVEAPDFPLARLAAIARRRAVLVVSPSRMRGGIDNAWACGVRGYVRGDDGDAIAAAVAEIAAGGDIWPAGWTPSDQPAVAPGGPRGAAVAVGVVLATALLAAVDPPLAMAAVGVELAGAAVGGYVYRREIRARRRAVDEAIARARASERAAYSRALHDRTLQTLEMLAAHADIDDGVLRHHLDDEARWLRGLVESGVDDEPEDLADAICTVVRRHSRPAFTVTFAPGPDALPVLPLPVVSAITGGVTEALTNAAKHAATDRAEVTVRQRRAGLTVEVADHGRGIGPTTGRGRFGIQHSIRRRMTEVGGSAEIRAAATGGTVVRLSYPVVS